MELGRIGESCLFYTVFQNCFVKTKFIYNCCNNYIELNIILIH